MSLTCELYGWVKQFTRPMRTRPTHLILDEFDSDFFLMFDFTDDPETPDSFTTCNIAIVPLHSEDWLADAITVVDNASKHGVMRMMAALGVQRFNEKARTAFYALSNPLRAENTQ